MILQGNETNFNQLEREIFDLGCQMARKVMKQILTEMDNHLSKVRDRKHYRDKGKRTTTIKTLMGEVEYSRRVYESINETGIKKYTYLLDETLEINKTGLFSGNLIQLITEAASEKSFRKTAKSITNSTGQSISHSGAWNIIQTIGKQIDEEENLQTKALAQGINLGQREKKILFEEADGVYLNIQGKDRKKGKKQELKVAISYEGWEKTKQNRYKVANKLVYAGFEPAAEFRKRKEGMLGSIYNLDEIQIRILNGDGASWIKSHSEGEQIHYQLDPFHKSRAIIRNVQDKEARSVLLTFLKENKYKEITMYLSALETETEDEKTKLQLKSLNNYFKENQVGLVPYLERGLELPELDKGLEYRTMGTMEHNICDVICQRMKHRKGSWSIAGGNNMAKILAWKASKRIKEVLNKVTSIHIPSELMGVIQPSLSAAQVPKDIGAGYSYTTRGSLPYGGAARTNGRNAILQLIADQRL